MEKTKFDRRSFAKALGTLLSSIGLSGQVEGSTSSGDRESPVFDTDVSDVSVRNTTDKPIRITIKQVGDQNPLFKKVHKEKGLMQTNLPASTSLENTSQLLIQAECGGMSAERNLSAEYLNDYSGILVAASELKEIQIITQAV